ncbi:ADC synthase, partial [Hesseltinella vesiculosa]
MDLPECTPLNALRTLIIDNYDSYTFNLLQLMTNDVVVIRNDQYSWDEFCSSILPHFDNIIISPGPGRPDRSSDFGVCTSLLQAQMDPEQPQYHRPIFGICLGHQGLGHIFGGKVIHAPRIMHGRMSQIHCHNPVGAAYYSIFQSCQQPFWAVRYHSLVVDPTDVPACLLLTATCDENDADILALKNAAYLSDDTVQNMDHDSHHHFLPPVDIPASPSSTQTIMGFQHKSLPLWGVQFHPESVSTEHGTTMIANFMQQSYQWMLNTGRSLKSTKLPMSIRCLSVDQSTNKPPAPAPTFQLPRKLQIMRSIWVDPEFLAEELLNEESTFRGLDVNSVSWLDSSMKSSPYSQTSIMSVNPALTLRYSTAHRQVRLESRTQSYTFRLPAGETFFDYVSRWLQAMGEEAPVEMVLPDQADDQDRLAIQHLSFKGGLVGYFGYEMKRESMDGYHIPPAQQCHSQTCAPNSPCWESRLEPDAAFHLVDRFWTFDHAARRAYLCCVTRATTEPVAWPMVLIGPDSLPLWKTMATEADANAWFSAASEAMHATAFAQNQKRLAKTFADISPVSSPSQPTSPNANATSPMHAGLLAPDVQRQDYLQSIQQAVDAIQEGESYEICLTTRFRLDIDNSSPKKLWRMYTNHLRKNNPAPFSAMLQFGKECCLFSSSPERFLKVQDRIAEMKPIKGTMARCLKCVCTPHCDLGPLCQQRQQEEDNARKQSLWEDVKERAENLMIVDLIRNDLAQVCEPTSVQVPKLMYVETYEKVHHLVSTVRGTLRPNVHSVDALKKCFPPGSMTGAPKLRSVQLLDELEQHQRRGAYSGCLGFISLSGDIDFNVIIRTAVVTNNVDKQQANLSVGGGGAITFLSNPEQEWDETLLKTKSVAPSVKEYLDTIY